MEVIRNTGQCADFIFKTVYKRELTRLIRFNKTIVLINNTQQGVPQSKPHYVFLFPVRFLSYHNHVSGIKPFSF